MNIGDDKSGNMLTSSSVHRAIYSYMLVANLNKFSTLVSIV